MGIECGRCRGERPYGNFHKRMKRIQPSAAEHSGVSTTGFGSAALMNAEFPLRHNSLDMSSGDTSEASLSSESRPPSARKRKCDYLTAPKATKARKDTSKRCNENAHISSSESDSSSGDSEENDEDTDEIQVLSHAAKRKLRNKEQKKAKGIQQLSESPAVDGIPKRQHSVWVGNLAFKTTEHSLRAFFQRGVPGCEVTRVHLPTKTGKDVGGGKGMRGENRGFAYVDFATKEVKEQAIALSEQNLDGRKLLIKDGTDFTGRPTVTFNLAATGTPVNSAVGRSRTAQRILAAQKQPPGPTLFLGNLGFQATEDSIRNMFTAHMSSHQQDRQKVDISNEGEDEGETNPTNDKKWLRKVRMGTFEDSGLCKGWAFVDFFNTEDSTTGLLDTRNHHLDGRQLVVEYASAEAVRRGGGPGARTHRDTARLKEHEDTAQVGKRLQAELKSKSITQGKPTAEDLAHQDEPPRKKAKTLNGKGREHGGNGKRTRPGAALALAKREKVAIVPSSGKKTIF